MQLRLGTVRAKLTTLVGLPVLLMVALFPGLSFLMNRALIDEVDDRVVDAQKSFQFELDDDLRDQQLALKSMTTDPDMHRALAAHDAKAAQELAGIFSAVYQDLDILIADADGKILADVGPNDAPTRLEEMTELVAWRKGGEFHGIVEHGCAHASGHAGPARVLVAPASNVGSIAVCQPLDRGYVTNSGQKLGLELALLDVEHGGKVVATTEGFPTGATDLARAEATQFEVGKTAWAVARFEPKLLDGAKGKLAVVAALDVTDIGAIVRRHFMLGIAVLIVAAGISVVVGARLASIMSRALAKVNVALKKLEKQEYVHVESVKTGDELEDLAEGFNTMVDGLKERDKLRTTFGVYMTESVVDHLMGGKIQLGGESLTVTILFSDIRSFTTLSEKMDAQDLVKLLNEYFTEMVGCVMQHGGVVDKYIGDAIMAVFGAPVPTPDDAKNAVLAAVRMRQALVHLNARLSERGIAPIKTGIGIHTGEVVAGNIGSERRMQYTVIGDSVNLASRLESSTKELGVNVLISDTTYEATKDVVVAKQVREIHVKGRNQPVMTYEVLGMKDEPPLAP